MTTPKIPPYGKDFFGQSPKKALKPRPRSEFKFTPEPEVNLGQKPQKYTPSLGSKNAHFLAPNSSYIRNFPKKALTGKNPSSLRTFLSPKKPNPKNDRRLAFTFLVLFGFSPENPKKGQKTTSKNVYASRPWPTGKGLFWP